MIIWPTTYFITNKKKILIRAHSRPHKVIMIILNIKYVVKLLNFIKDLYGWHEISRYDIKIFK